MCCFEGNDWCLFNNTCPASLCIQLAIPILETWKARLFSETVKKTRGHFCVCVCVCVMDYSILIVYQYCVILTCFSILSCALARHLAAKKRRLGRRNNSNKVSETKYIYLLLLCSFEYDLFKVWT